MWLNTEDVDQFVRSNRDYIESVVLGNGVLKQAYEQVGDAEADVLEFFRKVAMGEVTGNADGLPLFCLGDVRRSVQIRVSLSANNDRLPTDDAWWKDFFIDNAKDAELSILEYSDQLIGQCMDKHLKEYHLSGLANALWDEETQQQRQLSDICLHSTLSNLTGEQYYGRSTSQTVGRGFDWVVRYFHKRFNSGQTCKWFRVWNSGLVEHGGIVKADAKCAAAMGDSLEYANADAEPTCYKVRLDWSAEGVRAPRFKYATASGGFYYQDQQFDLGDGYAMSFQDGWQSLAPDSRYVVQLTPVSTGAQPYSGMFPSNNVRNGYYYVSKEVFGMTNASFCFVMTHGHDFYSYYAAGFVPNAQMEYR